MLAPDGARVALCCTWNGWGGKYLMDGDDGVARLIAAHTGTPALEVDFVLEGGAIESDGAGTLITTRSCLLNPNRHPGGVVPSEAAVETRLRAWLGVERIVWIDDGLHFDHTDGHVDNIARFVAPGVVAVGEPLGVSDPHRDRLVAIREQVARHGLEVVPLPSPGRVENPHTGELLPASHLNFFIAERAIVVPVYASPSDDAACKALEALFPGRRALPVYATHLLTGGGSVHCMTKEEPR
jgi:agmatine deiminase